MTFPTIANPPRLRFNRQSTTLILPVVVAAALAAAASVNIGLANAQETDNPCNGLPPITMSVFLDVLERQGSLTKATVAPSGECLLELTLFDNGRASLGIKSGRPICTVIAVPTPLRDYGSSVSLQVDGDCTSTAIDTQVVVESNSGTLAPSNGVGGASRSEPLVRHSQALAKIVFSEVINLPMIVHYTKLYWSHTPDLILDYTDEKFRWHNDNWRLVSASGSVVVQESSNQVVSVDNGHWYSNGYESGLLVGSILPDVEAWDRVEVVAQADGSFHCYHRLTRGRGWSFYPKLHTHVQCWGE